MQKIITVITEWKYPLCLVLLSIIFALSYQPIVDFMRYAWYGEGRDTISQQLQGVLTLSLSLLVEALPFLVFGVVVAVVFRLYIPSHIFDKVSSLPRAARRTSLSLLGMFFPVCECGNVPLARSLMQRGFNPGDAIAFLLAAPILNPIVLFVTWQAFSYDPVIFWGRFIVAFIVAHFAALVVVRVLKGKNILLPNFEASCNNHTHDDKSVYGATTLFANELWPLLRLLIIGGIIAAVIQVFVPREILNTVGSDPVLGVLAMIALGFVISICSSVDAFFALAFARIFQSGSILAFLVAGPMVDIKMLALLKSTFTTRALIIMTATVVSLSFLAGVGVNLYGTL